MTLRPSHVNRRYFLRCAGVTLALPLFESLSERVLRRGFVGTSAGEPVGARRPMRMVCVGSMLGFYPPAFFPTSAGAEYRLSPLLEPLAAHRGDFTVFSGLDHGVKGGHFAIHAFLSGVRSVDARGRPEGNISVDQRAAETIAGATRFPSLAVGSEDGIHGGCQMCWARSGTRVPPIPRPRELFRRLFVSDSESDRVQSEDRFRLHGSILDSVQGDARALQRNLGSRDREKLDEYFHSVRDVERQLQLNRQWADIPRPRPNMPEPPNSGFVSDLPVIYDLLALALQTDSTRIATLEIAGGFEASAFGLRKDWHALSHHGQVQDNIDGLLKIEKYQVEQLARFLDRMKSLQDGDGT